MKIPPRDEQKKIVRQWKETGRELEELRRRELEGKPYNWEDVDALLSLAAESPAREDNGLGLLEMKKWLMGKAKK